MAGISSIGVGSGLPLDTLLSDLQKAENLPLQLLAERKETAESRLSSYGVLKNALDKLQTHADKLSKPNSLIQLSAHSSHEGVGVQVDNNAIAGQYRLEVLQTARAQELVTQTGFEKLNTALTDTDTVMTVQLNDGSSEEITIKAGTTLSQFVEQINAHPKLGMDATLINDGSENPHRLMLRAQQTGTESAIQSIQFSDAALQDALGFDAQDSNQTTYQEQQAVNAHLKVNGIDVHSQSNKISGVISGVGFDISAHHSYDQAIDITITRDQESSSQLIKNFVDSFNNVLDTIEKQTRYDIETNTGSPLMGDSLARRIKSQLGTALHFNLPEGEIRTLTQIGIEINHATGRLQINEDKLNTALANNPHGVDQLFSDEQGFSQRIKQMTQPFLESKGYFDTANDSINREIKGIEQQYENMQYRIDMKMANYQRQFQQLDIMVSQMHQTSNYLEQQLGMLMNLNNGK